MIKNYLPLLCFIFILLPYNSFCQEDYEHIKSPIISSTTLKANTTYIVSNEILITNNATLTIEEGVTLKNPENHEVIISIENGSRVIASGSYDNPILASTNSSEKPIIVMKSSRQKADNSVVDNFFYYKSIENPTILMSSKSNSYNNISSVQGDF
ncbi:hypothetical protein [Aquimarina litoralis]|uniref:hypothetical protein n=1 Tax=Aquimarina litoralis TaxID=584605 RepID=UPI001C56B5D6|nr:hypothetical protein [Aquimarina litoralis]MBW1299094.1 hypothetical protein [Aquimarina litoralis]